MQKLIKHDKKFLKSYKKRIQGNNKLEKRLRERVNLFAEQRKHPQLLDHQLKGDRKGCRAFSVTGDIRVVYYEEIDKFIFLDIGTHTQVYDM